MAQTLDGFEFDKHIIKADKSEVRKDLKHKIKDKKSTCNREMFLLGLMINRTREKKRYLARARQRFKFILHGR